MPTNLDHGNARALQAEPAAELQPRPRSEGAASHMQLRLEHAGSARSLEEVQVLLQHCIDTAREENSADGYFPLVYQWETRDLIAAVATAQAPEKLENLIVVFANLYFAARSNFRTGRPVPNAWALAFRANRSNSAVVLQQLLLAVNAHINHDLAFALAEVDLPSSDFAAVGEILARSIDRIQERLNRTSIWLRVLDQVGRGWDELIAVQGLRLARAHAFDLATRLRDAPESEQSLLRKNADDVATFLGRRLLTPPLGFRLGLAAVRFTRGGRSPREVLDLLADG